MEEEQPKKKNKGGRPRKEDIPSNAGRPTKMTPMVIKKLEEALAIGCKITEACLYAGISTPPFYEYLKKNSDFANRVEFLKEKPILKARKTIFDNLSDAKVSQWFLERKRPEEFNLGAIGNTDDKAAAQFVVNVNVGDDRPTAESE